jgi:surface-anchored protein
MDTLNGITSTDASFLPASGHIHYNWGFTARGVYEVDLQASAYLGPGQTNPTSSQVFTVSFAVDSQAPVNTVPGPQATRADVPLVFSTARGNAIQVADPDAGATPLTVVLKVNNGTLALGSTAGLDSVSGDGTAQVTFTGSLASLNAALQGLTYLSSTTGPDTLMITTTDEHTNTDVDSVDITVQESLLVVGPGNQSNGTVQVFTRDHDLQFTIQPYGADYSRQIRVAIGDVNNDGVPDIITAPGPKTSVGIKVFDGQTGQLLNGWPGDVFPYGANYSNGYYVAAGDLDGNGPAEIIVGPGKGKKEVVILNAVGGTVRRFFAYGINFKLGVRVAAGDLQDGPEAEIVTAKGGGKSSIRVFDGQGNELNRFLAYKPLGGNYVAIGDVDGDGQAEIITGAEGQQATRVRWFDPATSDREGQVLAYPKAFRGGVRVGVLPREDSPDRVDIVTAPGNGRKSEIRLFDALTSAQLDSFFAFEATYKKGLFIAGG